ncbi:MAG: 3,4-dihydroxy-2-butanone-4-phosphate synthase [Myxococcales bacterium FL481]|nr:MAG: 3,4-dihydroxy-2-butanone-4-phosphate synthase [Myxococcales bacterium FL481]
MSSSPQTSFSHVERCIATVRNGGVIVMVDDEDRENEGDLVVAADHCTPEKVNFMCREARGLVCLALTPQRIEQLELPMMVPKRADDMSTAFTVSIEAREGVTTGISAADRARTIRVATDPTRGALDIVSPGHVFPLRAQPGGVLVRSGHTEGSVDIARLAGCNPAAVICEIMRDDGQMARMEDLRAFAARHELEVLTIADLIEYRLRNELLVEQVDAAPLPSPVLGLQLADDWTIRTFRSTVEPRSQFIALTKGELSTRDDVGVLLRAQRADMIGDLFGTSSRRSGVRMRAALRQIDRAGSGVFLYVVGDNAIGSRLSLGAEPDGELPARPRDAGFRDFGLGAQVLRALGVRTIRVMTNNPRKIVGLEGFGIAVAGSVALEANA